jgi:antitoxin MazE
MKLKLVKIGNSKGIRLPKALIEQAGLREDVEATVRGKQLILRSLRKPRAGWEESIKKSIKKYGAELSPEDK